jgi:hypothetical protein
MTDRLKLSEPKGDAELEKIATALEEAEYRRRYEQLKRNVHDLEQLVAEKEKRAWPAKADKTPRNKIGARKEGKFKAVSTAPSVNKTPAGPCMVPVAYPTSVDLSNSVGVAQSVRLNGKPTYVLGSSQPTCKGDEQGSGGGVRSGTVNGEVKPTGASTTVRAEGSRVVREGDPNIMNGGNNPGIYVTEPAPHASSPKNALSTSNPPITLQTPQEKSAFKRWLDKTAVELTEAVSHPIEGIKGAVKGVVNTPPALLQLLLEAAAQQHSAEMSEAAALQRLAGNQDAAEALQEVAAANQTQGSSIKVPMLEMSNSAQQGGEVLSTAVQIFAGGLSFAKLGVRQAGKTAKFSAKVEGAATAQPVKTGSGRVVDETGGGLIASGAKTPPTSHSNGVRVHAEAKVPEGISPDSRGVYGYLPVKGSRYDSKLYDFGDPAFVQRNRLIRIDYLKGTAELEEAIQAMHAAGYGSERIAYRVVLQRNSQKLNARASMSPTEVEVLDAGNVKRYGDAVGPTPRQLFDKYRSWDRVIEKSMEKDPEINMLLGLPSHH